MIIMADKKQKLTPFQQEQIDTAQKILEYKLASEANVVSILYQLPDLLYDISLNLDDFSNNVWKVFFTIINELVLTERKNVIDDVTVGLYLEKHPKLRLKYQEYGGWGTIQSSAEYVSIENFYGYLTELKKWKAVLQLCKRGFPVKDKLPEYADMTLEEIYDDFEIHLNNIFVNTNEDVQSYNVFDNMIDFVENLGEESQANFPFYDFDRLTEMTGGFNLNGNIYGLGAGSGVGKSTLAFNLIIPTAIKTNEKTVFFINEEDEKKFKKELLIWVANNVFIGKVEKYKKIEHIHKYEIRDGKFTNEIKELLIDCAKWVEEQKDKRILTVIPLERYSAKIVIKLIKKYVSAHDIRLFVLDTLKESFDAETNEIYKSMMRDMVALYDVVKPSAKNVGLFVTYQLGKGSVKMRHLTNNEIGQAKSILDVMSVNIMMRRPYDDEYEEGSKHLDCYYIPKGASKATKIQYKLKKDNHPMILFVTKNRFGETDTKQIIAECDLGTNICKDVAYTNVPQDW